MIPTLLNPFRVSYKATLQGGVMFLATYLSLTYLSLLSTPASSTYWSVKTRISFILSCIAHTKQDRHEVSRSAPAFTCVQRHYTTARRTHSPHYYCSANSDGLVLGMTQSHAPQPAAWDQSNTTNINYCIIISTQLGWRAVVMYVQITRAPYLQKKSWLL